MDPPLLSGQTRPAHPALGFRVPGQGLIDAGRGRPRPVEGVALGLKLLQHGLERGKSGPGRKQGLADLALLFEDTLPAPDQCLVIDAVHGGKGIRGQTVQKQGNHIRRQRAVCCVEKIVLLALAAVEPQFPAIRRLQAATKQQLGIGMDEIIKAAVRKAEQPGVQGAHGAAFSGLIGTVDHMQPRQVR